MASDDLILRPKRCKGDDGYRVFSIRVPEKTVMRLEEFVAQTGRSRNELIGTFLDYAMDHCVIEKEAETK